MPDWLKALWQALVYTAITLVVLFLIRALYRFVRKVELPEVEPDDADWERMKVDRLAEAVESGLAAVDSGTATDGVIACWVALEDAAASAGVPREPSETPAEFTVRVLGVGGISEPELLRLAQLYREARYSTHGSSEEARTEARAALRPAARRPVRGGGSAMKLNKMLPAAPPDRGGREPAADRGLRAGRDASRGRCGSWRWLLRSASARWRCGRSSRRCWRPPGPRGRTRSSRPSRCAATTTGPSSWPPGCRSPRRERRVGEGSLTYTRRIRPLLLDLTRDRLVHRHGIDPDLEPDRARELVGDQLWSLITGDRGPDRVVRGDRIGCPDHREVVRNRD